jgi:hypothetical protein
MKITSPSGSVRSLKSPLRKSGPAPGITNDNKIHQFGMQYLELEIVLPFTLDVCSGVSTSGNHYENRLRFFQELCKWLYIVLIHPFNVNL